MNGKQLKNSILQWAIQGKLVPQDPNDESASVLLERIRAEKAKMVKEKKIKKDKNESIIYRGEDNSYYEKFIATGEVKCIDEEIPFEIPQGWEWERWGNISQSIQYGYNAPALEKGVIRMVRISDIQDNKVVWDTVPFCMIEEQDIETYLLEENDILFARTGGTVGKSFLVEEVPLESIYAGYLIRTRYSSLLCPHYMKAFMESQLYWEQLKNGTIATAQPNCNGKTLAKMLLPIPPINEQKRIIEKLHRISSLVERYSKSQDALNLINTQIYDQLRKSILQYAIQGQLVPQLESEGNAEKLLEQIRQEKLHLVEEGKLKKSALTDSVIYKGDDNKYYERIKGQIIEIELPFEYPNNWVVLRLKDVCLLTDGEKRIGKGICLDAKYLRGKSSATIVEKGKFVYTGDNIILVDGENSGEVFTVPQDGYMGSTFKQLWLFSAMWKPYILAFILFYKEELRNSKRGAAIPHLNKELFYNLLIGIPPLAEQKRIAQHIDVLSQLLK
ncbi:restriction endonuclease subunit S [Alistipes finegoldii]|uniref:restriction endonuclease subunit S n=2 Tax=Bacteroidales TaxID=171549 RepID=UPI00242AC8B9|nr:restriction endonuclease subunit S [Alistipes finegoldii]